MGWVRIKKAAEILRLSPETVRQWSNEGRIRCYRYAAGQRVYDEDYLRTFTDSAGDVEPVRLFYVRSSSGQDVSISTQKELLEESYGVAEKVFVDKASGLNENRKGLNALLS